MNTQQNPTGAFTRFELLVTGLVLLSLIGVLVPAMIQRKRSAQLAACLGNLKQVGLAELLWVNDHDTSRLQAQLSTNKGGSLEYLERGDLFQHFKALSNELVVPRILICPSDNRTVAQDFLTLKNSNLSYFINIDALMGGRTGPSRLGPSADWDGPIVTGDRNVTNTPGQRAGILIVTESTCNQLGWNTQMHNKGRNRSQGPAGNVVYASGKAKSAAPTNLHSIFCYEVFDSFTNRLTLP